MARGEGLLDFEIIVADDASTDGSIEELLKRFPDVRVVRHERREGVSRTKDLGTQHARGEVLIFLDAHCKPDPGALCGLIARVAEAEAQAIIAPRIAALDADTWEIKRNQVGWAYILDLLTFQTRWVGPSRFQRPDGLLESPALMGCCFAVSRKLYEEYFGFDRQMLSWGQEDIDFGLKLRLAGHPLLIDRNLLVGHRFQAAFNYAVPPEHELFNKLRMARRNFSEETWEQWIRAAQARESSEVWSTAWSLFEQARESLEHERSILLKRRVHDEFWYAQRFGLTWPLPSSLGERKAESNSDVARMLTARRADVTLPERGSDHSPIRAQNP